MIALSSTQKVVRSDETIFRWFKAKELRYNLGLDYVVNTDSRSVIASTDWSLLAVENQPLFRSIWMQKSYVSRQELDCLELLKRFSQKRKIRWEFMPLNNMNGWQWSDEGLIKAESGEQSVGLFDVSLSDREVDTWCQPLVMAEQIQECILFMRIKNGFGPILGARS